MRSLDLEVDEVGVVVPAHNEEECIAACLRSVTRAARHPEVAGARVRIVVVLDSCTDETAPRASAVPGVTCIEVSHRNVGLARAAGFAELINGSTSALSRTWLSTTDADSRVPADWLARQLAWRRRGADAVAGTVVVHDWRSHPPRTRARFEAYQREAGTGLGHPHVHGANLGLSAQAYLTCGGMPGLALAEDHALWALLRRGGHRTVSAPDLPVVTSARRHGRADGGFASLLRSL